MLAATDIRCGYALLREILVAGANEDVYAYVLKLLADAEHIRRVIREFVNRDEPSRQFIPRKIPQMRCLVHCRGIRVVYEYRESTGVMVVSIDWLCSDNEFPDISSRLTGRSSYRMRIRYQLTPQHVKEYRWNPDVPLLE